MELHLTTATDNSVSHVQIITWNQTFWTKDITSEQSAQLIVLNGFNDALERRQDYQKQLDVLPSLFRVKMAEMEGYVIETKERWRVKFWEAATGVEY